MNEVMEQQVLNSQDSTGDDMEGRLGNIYM